MFTLYERTAERTEINWKNMLILLVVILAIAGIVGGAYFFGTRANTGAQTGTSGPSVASGTVTLTGAGLTLRAGPASDFPSYLRIEWEKQIALREGVLPEVNGRIVNTSSQAVKYDDIKVVLKDGRGSVLSTQTLQALRPGMVKEIGANSSFSFLEQLYYLDPQITKSIELKMVSPRLVSQGPQPAPAPGPQPSPKPSPTPTPQTGSWTKTFQTSDGPIIVSYKETSSAQGKAMVQGKLEGESPQIVRFYIQNISSKSFRFAVSIVWKDTKSGEIIQTREGGDTLAPNEINENWGTGAKGPTVVVEIRVEVK